MNQFQQALELHQSGQLREAEIGYRSCLQENPNHADALHLLGVIAHQCDRNDDAAELIGRAIAVNPHAAPYHCNLAEVCRARNLADQAVDSARRAIELQADYAEAHNNLGLALLARQEPDQAEISLRRATELRPEFASAWNNLGHALREQERNSDAVAVYREAVRLVPDMPEAHNNLGQILLENDEPDDALIHCREAVRLRPEFAEAHSNLGNAHRELGNPETARACYNEALRLAPDLGMIHNNMAQLLQEEGRLEEAVSWYRKALELEPNTLRFHLNLASAFADADNFAAAIEEYQTAIGIKAESAQAYVGLGQAYHEQGLFDQALSAFRQALNIKPDFAAAHTQIGHLLAQLGELEQAEQCWREAIAIEDKAQGAWVNLATHHGRNLSDTDVEHIEALLQQPRLKDSPRAALHFALAQICDSKQGYEGAANHTVEANRLQRQANQRRRHDYSPDEHTAFVDQLMECFNTQYFERVGQLLHAEITGINTRLPVFIIGMPRSGTTLTEQILASHPDIHGAGELRFARESFESLRRTTNVTTIGEQLAGLTAELIGEMSAEYQNRLQALNPSALRVIDKMPDNYLNLGWLQTLFPKARFIHCRRDVRSIAFSCWLTSFKSIRWANDPLHIANRIENYQRLMNHWSQCFPGNVLHVDYEQTVSDLPAVARRLVDHVGMPWDETCIDFHRTKRTVRTASVSQVREPVYQGSIARWKHYEHHLPELFAPVSSNR